MTARPPVSSAALMEDPSAHDAYGVRRLTRMKTYMKQTDKDR